jgi:hypothetical protein
MSGVWELAIALGALAVAVWLPGALVIKLSALLRPRGEESRPQYPAVGPAMDL